MNIYLFFNCSVTNVSFSSWTDRSSFHVGFETQAVNSILPGTRENDTPHHLQVFLKPRGADWADRSFRHPCNKCKLPRCGLLYALGKYYKCLLSENVDQNFKQKKEAHNSSWSRAAVSNLSGFTFLTHAVKEITPFLRNVWLFSRSKVMACFAFIYLISGIERRKKKRLKEVSDSSRCAPFRMLNVT